MERARLYWAGNCGMIAAMRRGIGYMLWLMLWAAPAACQSLPPSAPLPAAGPVLALRTVSALAPTTTTPWPPTLAAPSPKPSPTPSPTPQPPVPAPTLRPVAAVHQLGRSSLGYPLTAWQVGRGPEAVVLIGGLHGGYEWNTILLAYQMLDYFAAQAAEIPPSISLYIIPSANPDGQALVTGTSERFTPADVAADAAPGRFNGRGVDLNRNWACDWVEEARWRDQRVWGGSAPFSESESQTLRDFILALQPRLTLFWHSAADGVYLARCDGVEAAATRRLASLYAAASGYALQEPFAHYPINGDASDYLSGLGLASFSVELSSHAALDWQQNLAGVQAVLAAVAETAVVPTLAPE